MKRKYNTGQGNTGFQTTLDGEKIPEDWDFAKADTSYLTHGLHDYPARMIPQIAHRLISRYSPEKGKILDPFCGSGTILVEARLANRSAIGIDVNPLAVLLSKVKSTPLDFEELALILPISYQWLKGNMQKQNWMENYLNRLKGQFQICCTGLRNQLHAT